MPALFCACQDSLLLSLPQAFHVCSGKERKGWSTCFRLFTSVCRRVKEVPEQSHSPQNKWLQRDCLQSNCVCTLCVLHTVYFHIVYLTHFKFGLYHLCSFLLSNRSLWQNRFGVRTLQYWMTKAWSFFTTSWSKAGYDPTPRVVTKQE